MGAQRPHSWYKYFSKFGVSPVIVTRHWEGVRYGTNDNLTKITEDKVTTEVNDLGIIIRAPFRQNLRDKLMMKYGSRYGWLRKVLTIFYNIIDLLTIHFDSKREIYLAAKNYLSNHKVDYIIATGEPYILFKYASQLSKEFGIPRNADYRDDWIGNHIKGHGGNPIIKLIVRLESFFEQKFMKNAHSFTTVNQEIAANIANRTSIGKHAVIENGADLDIVNAVDYNQYPEKFIITYTGIMYDFNYFEPFAAGFELFMAQCQHRDKVKLCLVGIDSYQNQAVRAAYKLREQFPNHVEIIGNVPLKEAVAYQKQSSVLLNLIPADPSKGMLSAKAAIYAAVKRPILSIPLIKKKETPFFQGRNIHTIAVDASEVNTFLNERFETFMRGASLDTDITEAEVYALSRE